MADGRDTREVDWAALAAPVQTTAPWRPAPGADAREADWAGRGFTRPGPEPDAGYQAGYAPGRVEAAPGMTATFDGPATSITEGYVNGHRQMSEHLAREANGREAEGGG
jgi:hypothetical protein